MANRRCELSSQAAYASRQPQTKYENAAAPSREPGEGGGISVFTVGKGVITFLALNVG